MTGLLTNQIYQYLAQERLSSSLLSLACGHVITLKYQDETDLKYFLDHFWPVQLRLSGTSQADLISIPRNYSEFLGKKEFEHLLSRAYVVTLYRPRLDENISDYDQGITYRDDDWRLIYNPKTNGTILRKNGTVLCFNGTASSRHRDLRRATKQVLTNWIFQIGGMMLHASAFALANTGVLVVGAKGAGKTTFLRCALTNFGARFLANDRVGLLVDPLSASNVRLMPWTEPLRVIDQGCQPVVTKREFSLAEFLRNDPNMVSHQMPLGLVIVPELSNERGLAIRRMARQDLIEAIDSECLPPGGLRRPSWLYDIIPPTWSVSSVGDVEGYRVRGSWEHTSSALADILSTSHRNLVQN